LYCAKVSSILDRMSIIPVFFSFSPVQRFILNHIHSIPFSNYISIHFIQRKNHNFPFVYKLGERWPQNSVFGVTFVFFLPFVLQVWNTIHTHSDELKSVNICNLEYLAVQTIQASHFHVDSEIFHQLSMSSHTMALKSTQPLTERSTRDLPWGVKAAAA
jgi:hypothetical protein